MDVLVIGLWLAVVAIVGLIFAKGVLLHLKRSARAERQRRRHDELIVEADPDHEKVGPDVLPNRPPHPLI